MCDHLKKEADLRQSDEKNAPENPFLNFKKNLGINAKKRKLPLIPLNS
jgi:hypothetical protein|tara:strand:- start:165 stop:308 length:144 start_codon:yes stop_codon:yes gene_type:complete